MPARLVRARAALPASGSAKRPVSVLPALRPDESPRRRAPCYDRVRRVKSYRYYDLILGAYVCVVLCANLIGAAKVATVQVPLFGPVTFMAGVLFFPISYFFGDVLTEVYGYARDRRVVWSGFAALGFASLMSVVIVHLPPAEFWRTRQAAVEEMFGNTPRIACGSMVAFWCGSFVNSYVLAKMKIWTRGRWLWTRTIGSTLCGELVDSALFYTIAFGGLWPTAELLHRDRRRSTC